MADILVGSLVIVIWGLAGFQWFRSLLAPRFTSDGEARKPSRQAGRSTPLWDADEGAAGPILYNPGPLKAAALRACRLAADDYADEYPRQMDELLEKVSAWRAVPGPAERQGWAVYHRLGILRKLTGEPLLRDLEAAVLKAVTATVDCSESVEAR